MEQPEAILLSSIIQSQDSYTPAEAGITPEHFHIYRGEYRWVTDYTQKNGKCPSKTLFRRTFPDFPLLKADDLDWAIEEVKKSHLRQQLIKTLHETSGFIKSDQPKKALAYLHSNVVNLESNWDTRQGGLDLLGEWEEVFNEAVRRSEQVATGGVSGVPTGFPTLDDRLAGFQPGDLVICAARFGHGKTWVLCKMAATALMQGYTVQFDSLEQDRAQIAFRIHALLGRMTGHNISNRSLVSGMGVNLKEYREFLQDLRAKLTGNLFVSDAKRGKVTPVTLAAQIERNQPDVVFVDYLTLLGSSSGQSALEDWRIAASLSADAKQLAQSYSVPVVAAAQINRQGAGGVRPPSAKHLSQSDNIGQDADVVLTMKKYADSALQLLLAKHRHGQDGAVFYARFKPDKGDISEIPYEKALEIERDEAMEEEF